jgi:NAD+ kinase
MVSVLLVSHHERAAAGDLAVEAAQWLRGHGHECWMLPRDAAALSLDEYCVDRDPREADLVLSLGGDGTMLRAVHLVDGAPIPLLGVNLGRLGYLTEVEAVDLIPAIERFIEGPDTGRWHLDERLMLEFTVRTTNGENLGTWRALNEGVLEKRDPGQTVRLQVRIDGAPFTTYAADGLILATPTGSTAYSFSARGPVVSPRHRAILLTPVAPHMLFDRSLVLDPTETVELEVLEHQEAELAIDGVRVAVLGPGDLVTCRPSVSTAQFVRFVERQYHQILKAKFGLMDR